MFRQKPILDIAKPKFPVYLYLIIEPIGVPNLTKINYLKDTKKHPDINTLTLNLD
jgi:hypothetical protein